MKYYSILCLGLITSCSEDTKDGIVKTAQEQEPPISSQYESTKDYISDVGIAHILEEKLEGYELKAAIVNSFQTTLFYYNADLEQLCIRPEEAPLHDGDTMVFKINGKDTLAQTGYFLTEDRENGKIVAVDFDGMSKEKNDALRLSGSTLAYGFKFKLRWTPEFGPGAKR